MVAASPHSRRLIAETLRFLCQTLHMRGAMFYWIEPELETTNDTVIGLPDGLTERYRREMFRLDPLLAARLVRAGKRIADLECEALAVPAAGTGRYRAFLESYGVRGNMDFLFWTGAEPADRAFGGISLVRLEGDPPFPQDAAHLQALHRYVGFALGTHERVRRERLRGVLARGPRLTARECDICELIADGATNQDIADALTLTIATVKTYVRQIFDKMGADNRTALAARLAALQLD